MKLTILDVGHGQCAVLRDASGVLVVDTGAEATLLTFMESNSISEIDAVLVSHSDADHVAGLIALLLSESVHIKRIYLNPDADKKSDTWIDLRCAVADATKRGTTITETGLSSSTSSEAFSRGDIKVDILAPAPDMAMSGPGGRDTNERRLTANSMSVVVRISYKTISRVLLTGDLDGTGLENLLEYYPSPRAQYLMFPHHGGLPATTDPKSFARRICEAVRPEVIVFSIGRGNYQTPRPEIIEGIRSTLPNAYIACTQLSSNCAKDVPTTNPTHLGQIVARGSRRRACCAGSIQLVFRDDEVHSIPSREGHQRFVASSAPSALCQRQLW